MTTYQAPLEDMRFVLNEVIHAEKLAELPGYEEATPDIVDAILEEGAKLAANELHPLNAKGDAIGAQYENGVVRMPPGFKEAYDLYAEGGWGGLCQPADYGGQGMPQLLGVIFSEMVTAANMAFGMVPGLTEGAMHAIEAHADDALKSLYLPKMTAGAWSGTMNLTEPQCGTDLGLIRSKAIPQEDGSYAISGTKIYISAGEQDMTENIIHLVLARLPDAPPGIRGISLFLVPKFLPKEESGDWVPGPRNGVQCLSIEEKMGIHASPTCVMEYTDAKGWLVGEPHKGMRAMFTMMNAARLGVGMQGLGIAEVAYQNAVTFAKDRLQGRALTGAKYPDKPADPILVHADVRKTLLRIRAFTEGARALAYWTAYNIDLYHRHPEEEAREAANDLVSLLTPVIKAYMTDMGLEATNLGMQVHGGAGYVRDYGVEQFMRDARIALIYEGTNGIQALDLVGRKLPMHTGRLLRRFFHPVSAYIEANMETEALAEFLPGFARFFGKLQQATAIVAQKGLSNPDEAGAAATDYLRLFALVAMGFMWLRMIEAAQAALDAGANGKADFYERKIALGRFFMNRMLPEAEASFRAVMAGSKDIMALPEEAF